MDWSILYQATAFLAIALLAVVVTIFVLASSLLGRAIESASEEEEKKRREQEKIISKQVRQAREQFEKAAKGTGEFEEARESLRSLQKQKRRFEKQAKHIQQSYQVFRVKGGVLRPSLCFLSSLILGGIAWGLSRGDWQWISVYVWVLGLIAMGWGLYRIYSGLRKIESVAITSEEVALIRTMEAFRIALKKHEDERKPKLRLQFTNSQPPFHAKKDTETKINFIVKLTNGDIARKVEVWFFAPMDFEFSDLDTWHQSASYTIPNALTAKHEFKDILAGINYNRTLRLKPPAREDTYILAYRLYCEGFTSKLEKFKIVIE